MLSTKSISSLPKVISPSFDSAVVTHAFFTRQGGVSTGHFASLNTCAKPFDDKRNVVKNLEIIANDMGISVKAIKKVNQIHSNIAYHISDINTDVEHIPADAIVTKTPGILIGIDTADCTPILFADHENKVIAAAHAGWKGAIGGIIENTIRMMEKIGAEKENIVAVIGPTIAQKSYEVDHSYRQKFLDENKQNAAFFIPSQNIGHYMFDLPNFCAHVLQSQGLKLVQNTDVDTYSNSERFFSFRKTTHQNEKNFGGQLSAIMLNDSL